MRRKSLGHREQSITTRDCCRVVCKKTQPILCKKLAANILPLHCISVTMVHNFSRPRCCFVQERIGEAYLSYYAIVYNRVETN